MWYVLATVYMMTQVSFGVFTPKSMTLLVKPDKGDLRTKTECEAWRAKKMPELKRLPRVIRVRSRCWNRADVPA